MSIFYFVLSVIFIALLGFNIFTVIQLSSKSEEAISKEKDAVRFVLGPDVSEKEIEELLSSIKLFFIIASIICIIAAGAFITCGCLYC